MKKLCLILAFIPFLALGGCTQSAPSYKNELISSDWSASLEGGAQITLDFEGEADGLSAELTLNNAEKTVKICGECLADEHSFVIFDKSVMQNYAFEYIPMGKTLDLCYNGSTLNLKKI